MHWPYCIDRSCEGCVPDLPDLPAPTDAEVLSALTPSGKPDPRVKRIVEALIGR